MGETQRRLFADFNRKNPQGRVRLNCARSLREIAALPSPLRAGETVWLYDEEGGVEATLEYDAQHAIWLAMPRWNTWREPRHATVLSQAPEDVPDIVRTPPKLH